MLTGRNEIRAQIRKDNFISYSEFSIHSKVSSGTEQIAQATLTIRLWWGVQKRVSGFALAYWPSRIALSWYLSLVSRNTNPLGAWTDHQTALLMYYSALWHTKLQGGWSPKIKVGKDIIWPYTPSTMGKNLRHHYKLTEFYSHQSSGIHTPGYGLQGWVSISVRGKTFSRIHCVETASEVHPASYAMGTRGCLSRSEVTGAWNWPPNVDINNGGAILSLQHTSSWRGALIIKHWDNCSYTYIYTGFFLCKVPYRRYDEFSFVE